MTLLEKQSLEKLKSEMDYLDEQCKYLEKYAGRMNSLSKLQEDLRKKRLAELRSKSPSAYSKKDVYDWLLLEAKGQLVKEEGILQTYANMIGCWDDFRSFLDKNPKTGAKSLGLNEELLSLQIRSMDLEGHVRNIISEVIANSNISVHTKRLNFL